MAWAECAEEYKVILDIGSCLSKCGSSDDDAPRYVDYSIAGRKLKGYHNCVVGCGTPKDVYMCSEARSKSSILSIEHPVQRGIVKNWEHYEQILFFSMYNSLCVCPEEHGIFMPYYPYNPFSDSYGITQILFETFNVPRMMLSVAEVPIFELYLGGRGSSGILVECGSDVLRVYPIYKNQLLTHSVGKWNFGGKDITDYLQKLLASKYFFHTSEEIFILDGLKIEKSFVSQNYMEDLRKYKENNILQEYTLPDGSILELGSEIFESSEAYFQPHLFGESFIGIQNAIFETIQKCDDEIRMELCQNIVLAGGSIINGMDIRLKNELSKLMNCDRLNVQIVQGHKYASWTASSVVCSIEGIESKFFNHNEYGEYGPAYVHKKTLNITEPDSL